MGGAVTIDYPPTPECDKLGKVAERTQLFFEIIEWLGDSTDPVLCSVNDTGRDVYMVGTGSEAQRAVAQFFDIDLDEVEHEKRRVLDWVRAQETKGGT